MELKVVVKPGEAGFFVAHVPALKGCWSQGKTREEALANIREAAALWLEVEQEKRAQPLTGAAEAFAVQI